MGLIDKTYRKWFTDPPMPAAGSYGGQTVAITGGTSGLGLAAATHFGRLGARRVIITGRNAARGEAAKKRIESKTRKQGVIEVMELDMGGFASCVAFVEGLKERCAVTGLDYVVLNAGLFTIDFKQTVDGWEEAIQVNALSTLLIALLLLPWMKAQRAGRKSPAHLNVVSSGGHVDNTIGPWLAAVEKDGGVLTHFNKPENLPRPPVMSHHGTMYTISKLILEYGLEEVEKLALGPDWTPEVIVTCICPGPVKTDLARRFADKSAFFRLVALPAYNALNTVTPEYGSKIYVLIGLAGAEEHGKFIQWYWSKEQYAKKAEPVLYSDEARRLQALVWKEITGILSGAVPSVRAVIQGEETSG